MVEDDGKGQSAQRQRGGEGRHRWAAEETWSLPLGTAGRFPARRQAAGPSGWTMGGVDGLTC